VDPDAMTLDGRREPAGQPGGLKPRTMRTPRAADGSGHRDPRADLRPGQVDQVVRPPAELPQPGRLRVEPTLLCRVGGDAKVPRFDQVGFDPLPGDHVDDLVHGSEHGALHPHRLGMAMAGSVAVQVSGRRAHQPAPVASGSAEAGELPLDHQHAQVGTSDCEVVGRPETREAATDDGHVRLAVTCEWWPPRRIAEAAVPPRHPAVDERRSRSEIRGHCSSTQGSMLAHQLP
jgi:hypothetical protein